MGGAGQGSTNDIDPNVNYLQTDLRSLNTQYHKYTDLSKHNKTETDETINADSFTTYDQSALNKINPYIKYLNADISINDTQYYT